MLEKFPAEAATFNIDCSDLLPSGVTITGTPTMSFLPALSGGDALTFGSPTVNSQAVTFTEPDGTTRTAPIGTVIQVRISGGTSASNQTQRSYSVLAQFTASNGDTLVAKALLAVLSTAPA